MLAGRHLVVAGLHGDAHLLQREDGLATEVGGGVQRGQVEVAAAVQGCRAFGVGEVEVLQLGPNVESEAQVGGPLKVALQDIARVALEGIAVGLEDVAEDAGHPLPVARTPGEDDESARVGHGYHVALVDAGETFDGGAVEANPFR